MNYDELNKKLEELKIEDFIWVIYIGIIVLSWYSNSLVSQTNATPFQVYHAQS